MVGVLGSRERKLNQCRGWGVLDEWDGLSFNISHVGREVQRHMKEREDSMQERENGLKKLSGTVCPDQHGYK